MQGQPQKLSKNEQLTAFIKENADKALIPPEIKNNPSYCYNPECDDYTMSCGMDRTPGGRIWLAWFGGGDNEKAFIVMAKSDDDGKTFSEPQFVMDGGYVDRVPRSVVVGNLWTSPDGKLHLFFMLSLGYYEGRAGCWDAVCENPDDAKPLWSIPKRIWHGCALNKPTVLADGTCVLPINLWARDKMYLDAKSGGIGNLKVFTDLDQERKTYCFISKDKGANWIRSGSLVNPPGIRTFDEPMIVERSDSSLLMLQRELKGITSAESFDKGKTWTNPVHFQVPNAEARFFLRKLASGKILLVKHSNPQDQTKRSHLTAYLSDDDGKTWYGNLLIDARDKISYPDGFQTPDGRIFIQYDRERERGEILMTVFSEEDIIAGEYKTASSRKPYPVIQTGSMRKRNK